MLIDLNKEYNPAVWPEWSDHSLIDFLDYPSSYYEVKTMPAFRSTTFSTSKAQLDLMKNLRATVVGIQRVRSTRTYVVFNIYYGTVA